MWVTQILILCAHPKSSFTYLFPHLCWKQSSNLFPSQSLTVHIIQRPLAITNESVLTWTTEHLYFQTASTRSSHWEVFFPYRPSKSPLSGAVTPQKLTSGRCKHILWNTTINQAWCFFFFLSQVTCSLGLPQVNKVLTEGEGNAAVGDTLGEWALCSWNVLVLSSPLNDSVEEWSVGGPIFIVWLIRQHQPMTDSSGNMITLVFHDKQARPTS